MSRAKGNPLTPASLAANGNQGADRAGQSANELEHTAESAESLLRIGMALALSGIDALALLTDDPAAGIVDAADLIEAADEFLRAGAKP
jgi:aminoglycoside/choline kinase family phosphotransferase